MPVPSQDLDFQHHNMSFFLCVFSEFSEDEEAIVCFVDIGGNDDHYCLNFLFITNDFDIALNSDKELSIFYFMKCSSCLFNFIITIILAKRDRLLSVKYLNLF